MFVYIFGMCKYASCRASCIFCMYKRAELFVWCAFNAKVNAAKNKATEHELIILTFGNELVQLL